jgi:DinB family protein
MSQTQTTTAHKYSDPKKTLSRQLAEIDAQFAAASDRARAVVERVGVAKITVRPQPERWSVAECLVHLNLTLDAYFPLWKEAFAEAQTKNLRTEKPLKMDFWGKLLAWTLEPPYRMKMPTKPNFLPAKTGPAEQVLPTFLEYQDRMHEVLKNAAGLALDRVKIPSPFAEKLRYSVWSSFCVNAAHERRHLWQAERVADELTKP